MTGVGGQGILLASEITAQAAIISGLQAKVNEIHGMAQRGGSVVSQVKFGEGVNSPLIEEGTADVIMSLEAIEALRYRPLLKKGGTVITSTQKVIPVTVSSGKAVYPEPEPLLKAAFDNLVIIDAMEMAEELGEPRAANIILLGAMSKLLPLKEEAWLEAIAACVKPKALEINLKAFALGKKK